MKRGQSKFIKPKRLSAAVIDHKMDKLQKTLEQHKKLIDAVNENYQRHVKHLANFARHDMKNSVQSMDSILNTLTLEELTQENWNSLKACLENIRTTIDDFSKLAPIDSDASFKLPDLINGVELLSRSMLDSNGIEYKFEFPRKSEIVVYQSFHRVLQLLHNLVINAVKALESKEYPKLHLTAVINENSCAIEVYDNGFEIPDSELDKIFEYGYSTTGGSGIGLYHARYSCEQLEGKIEVVSLPNQLFTKKFTVMFPVAKSLIND